MLAGGARLVIAAAVAGALLHVGAAVGAGAEVHGRLLSAGAPLAQVPVTLYRVVPGHRPHALGRATTRVDGRFGIPYRAGAGVVYLLAGKGAAVRLAAVLGSGRVSRQVVVTERTTVAAAFALAQFVHGRAITGKAPGLQNGAAMAQNLADVRTGGVAPILARAPNGPQTSTLRAFDSLANMIVPCAQSGRCATLSRLAGGARGTLAAVGEIARNPWRNVRSLYTLARAGPYRPALSQAPTAWTLALRFVGDGHSVDGPGNMAIDARGNVWVTNNYTYAPRATDTVCGGKELLELSPTGRFVRGSPWPGGGLDGAGFGITLDPRGHIWVGNFGFAAPDCTQQPAHDSVSELSAAGEPLSGDGGYTQGPISWPQGTISDRQGNIWIANCGNDSVVKYVGGNPDAFRVLGNLGISEPFDLALNLGGQAFVTGNASNSVAMLNPDGSPASAPITGGGLSKPLGIAADTRGNMWVANSTLVTIPCSSTDVPAPATRGGSISFIDANGVPAATSYKGGGLTIPWGIAVDGADHVWVANFGKKRLSEFCGARPSSCPPGRKARGTPISPPSGYEFDGLVRDTGVQIDPTGNVWVCNNWKTVPIQANPGGYQLVVFLGLASPIRTPLIGPPRPL